MKNGLGLSSARAVRAEALAKFSTSVRAEAMGWAAGGAYTDRDPGSDRRMVQRVRALYHSTALGSITQTERGGRTRHLEYITEGKHIWSKDIYIMKKKKKT